MTMGTRSSIFGVLVLLGCTANPSPNDHEVTVETAALSAQTITAQMSLPSGLTSAAFLVAQNKVQLDSGVVVNGATWSAGSVVMQPSVQAQAVTCTGNVTLADRDTITTLTYGGTLTKGIGDVIGSATRTTLTNVASSTSVTFPATNQNVTVNAGQSRSLSPGSYVSVNVSSNATLVLAAGDYYMSALTVESAGLLQANPGQGATRIFIASSFTYRGTMATGADPSRFLVEYLGTTPLTLGTQFLGAIIVPRTSLTITPANGQVHRGSFMAQSIEVQPNTKLEFVRFNPAGTVSSCAAGTWDPDGNPFTPCVAKTTCVPGTYVSSEGTTTSDRTCTGCASGQFTTASNAASCAAWTTCLAGTYVTNTPSATADRNCLACPAGQTTTGDNQSQCLPVVITCLAGTVQTGNTCTACVPGQYCAGGTNPQVPCAEGTWDHDANPATVCVAKTTCLAGTYVASEGSTTADRTCTACTAGTFSTTNNAGTCIEWTTCYPGTFVSNPPSATSNRVCNPCPSGQYSSGNDQATCLDQGACLAGSVQSAPGTPSSPPTCAACEPGNFCAGDTAPAVACAEGTWDHDGSAATPCVNKTACVPGGFVGSEGSAVTDRQCLECPTGQFSTTTNAAACYPWTDCVAGTFVSGPPSPTVDRTCEACAANSYSATSNAPSCQAYTVCEAGTYVATAGSSTSDALCMGCGAGTFSATSNAPACQAWTNCPANTYVSNTPSASTDRVCTPCPSGQTSGGGGVTSCTSDPPIAVGANHVCAVISGGVQCWGDNYRGTLGDGTTNNRSVPGPVVGMGPGSGVTALVAGYMHTCAVINGGVQCWGDNSVGQLGNNSTQPSSVPVQVVGLGSGVTTVIGAGSHHTCVLVDDGSVRCWGMNNKGQLGNGTTAMSRVPVVVLGLAAPTSIVAGWWHTCAVVGGTALCWGDNQQGELGNGTTIDSTVPVQVSGLPSNVHAMSANVGQTCALVGNSVRCWGFNEDGTLGDGTMVSRLTPVQVLGLESGASAIAGAGYHLCVLLSSGAMQCWGMAGGYGELGDGTLIATRTSPTQVVGLTSGVTSMGTGYYNGCARANGALLCWGDNGSGQVGDGTTTIRSIPTPVLLQ